MDDAAEPDLVLESPWARAAAFVGAATAGRQAQLRSAAKTVTYRLAASTVTALLAFAYTRRLAWALGIGGADALAKLVLYYLHERAWDRVSFGRTTD